jgi:protein O-mannosyl-transferase
MLFDDSDHVTAPALRGVEGLWRIWTELGATQQYYPVLHSAFWVEQRLWGDSVTGYHWANIAQHALAACLLALILLRLRVKHAWLAAALFAAHPVAVESTAWIAEQKNTLSAVFYFAAALAYLRFDQSRRRAHYAPAFALFVLALGSKSVTATLPAALLVVLWWRHERLQWRRDVAPLAPWLVAGLAAGLFTAWVERTWYGAQGAGFALPALDRCLLAGRIFWFYAAKAFWPWPLMVVYPHWTVSAALWWQYLYPLAAVALAAALWLRRARRGLALWLLFAGALAPALGFFNVYPFLFSYVADHYMYLALPAACVAAAWALTRKGPAPAWAALALLAALSWQRAALFRDPEALYADTLTRNPEAWMMHNNLGAVLSDKAGRMGEAIGHFRAALRLKPDYAVAHYNLASALSESSGNDAEAESEYRTALRLNPDYAAAEFNLGTLLLATPARRGEAIAHFESALRLRPGFAEAHANLGAVLAQMPGRLDDAITHLETAVLLNPALAEARHTLDAARQARPR